MKSKDSVSDSSSDSAYNIQTQSSRPLQDPYPGMPEADPSPGMPEADPQNPPTPYHKHDDEILNQTSDITPSHYFQGQSAPSSSSLERQTSPAGEYSLFKPANIEEAKFHGVMLIQLASKVRRLDHYSVLDSQANKCPCCMMPIVIDK